MSALPKSEAYGEDATRLLPRENAFSSAPLAELPICEQKKTFKMNEESSHKRIQKNYLFTHLHVGAAAADGATWALELGAGETPVARGAIACTVFPARSTPAAVVRACTRVTSRTEPRGAARALEVYART